jgi:diguanylate cyclase (GGDEF)-like protein/PAS domain S-box-containing protein
VEDTELLLGKLKQGGYEVTYERVDSAERLSAALDRQSWDIVLSDYNMPNFSGGAALILLKESGSKVPFVFVSGTIGEDVAVDAIRAGASDYVMKSNLKRLLPIIQRVLRESEGQRERNVAEEKLQQSEERFRQLAENITEVFWMTGLDMAEILYISPGYEKVWGRSCASLYAQPAAWLDAIHPEDRDRVTRSVMNRPVSGVYDEEYRIIRPDGSIRWIHDRAFPIKDASGRIYRIAGIAEEITGQKAVQEALRKSEVLYRTLAEAAQDAIFVLDLQGYLQYVNGFAAWQLGRNPEEIIGKRHDELFPSPVAETQQRNIREVIETAEPVYTEEELIFKNQKRWMSIRLVPLKNDKGAVDAILGIARDISERKRTEELIHHIAFYDTPTGLPNRNKLYDHLLDTIKADGGKGMRMALLLMDLDRFREINDTLGHHRGDLLLQQLGERLQKTTFDRDIVARLGGDEFAILLTKLMNDNDIHLVIAKITRALEAPFVIEGIPIAVEISIGIALYPEQGADPDTLIQRADIAMSAAKKSGRGHLLYSPEIDEYNPKRLALLGELRNAIDQEQLVLHYQPKITLKDRKVFGVEALVRWKHPQQGMIPPNYFIGPAEQTGLIHPLTRWVVQAAIRQCAAWRQAGFEITVSANLSARNLLDAKLPDMVLGLLQASGLTPEQIEFEITESAIMTDPARAQEVLAALHRAGIRFSIDDFGIGYSSLSYLQKLPVDAIKIDRSFVSHMVRNEGDMKIVRSTIELAHNLGLKVVAEGVETQEILDQLTEMGCDAAQGYFISRPIPNEDLIRWLESPHHF